MTTYRAAGVDIDAQDEALRRVKQRIRSTFTSDVLADIGLFGGLFDARFKGTRHPVLVASADGVGTKLRVAFMTGRHDTVGKDLLHHCINDILVQGARPLFFLDYLATGKLDPGVAEEVIGGLADACAEQGVALLGGETAEMPGFYGDGEYDLAGFIVGVVDRRGLLDGSRIRPKDVLVGLPSTGLHTNGYSLARKIFFEILGLDVGDHVEELGRTVGEALLEVHRCYLEPVWPLVDRGLVHGMAHITGGGLTDNLPRVLPDGLGAEIRVGSWEIPPLFRFIAAKGKVPREDMWRTFNMGVGMVLAISSGRLGKALELLRKHGLPGFPMGIVTEGKGVGFDEPPAGFPTGLE